MAKLTKEKREEMFTAWCEKSTVYSVAKRCGISETTVKKYRDKEKWLERQQRVNAKVERKTENDIAKRQARHVSLSQLLQSKGFDALQGNEAKKITPVKVKTAFEARQCIVDGVKLEREVLGDDEGRKDTQINIQVVYVD
jgi:hypothetical protein